MLGDNRTLGQNDMVWPGVRRNQLDRGELHEQLGRGEGAGMAYAVQGGTQVRRGDWFLFGLALLILLYAAINGLPA